MNRGASSCVGVKTGRSSVSPWLTVICKDAMLPGMQIPFHLGIFPSRNKGICLGFAPCAFRGSWSRIPLVSLLPCKQGNVTQLSCPSHRSICDTALSVGDCPWGTDTAASVGQRLNQVQKLFCAKLSTLCPCFYPLASCSQESLQMLNRQRRFYTAGNEYRAIISSLADGSPLITEACAFSCCHEGGKDYFWKENKARCLLEGTDRQQGETKMVLRMIDVGSSIGLS